MRHRLFNQVAVEIVDKIISRYLYARVFIFCLTSINKHKFKFALLKEPSLKTLITFFFPVLFLSSSSFAANWICGSISINNEFTDLNHTRGVVRPLNEKSLDGVTSFGEANKKNGSYYLPVCIKGYHIGSENREDRFHPGYWMVVDTTLAKVVNFSMSPAK